MSEFVIVESPYNGPDEAAIRAHITYARMAVAWCLERGYAPFASHLLYTQPLVLDDRDAEQRELGIDAGLELARRADRSIFFIDLGWSQGMMLGRAAAEQAGRPWERVRLFEPSLGRDEIVERLAEMAASGEREGWSSPHDKLRARELASLQAQLAEARKLLSEMPEGCSGRTGFEAHVRELQAQLEGFEEG